MSGFITHASSYTFVWPAYHISPVATIALASPTVKTPFRYVFFVSSTSGYFLNIYYAAVCSVPGFLAYTSRYVGPSCQSITNFCVVTGFATSMSRSPNYISNSTF